MPVTVNGQTYYRTAEVCQIVGISRNTLFRWLKQQILMESGKRDRRGWRLFAEDDLYTLKTEANQIHEAKWVDLCRPPAVGNARK